MKTRKNYLYTKLLTRALIHTIILFQFGSISSLLANVQSSLSSTSVGDRGVWRKKKETGNDSLLGFFLLPLFLAGLLGGGVGFSRARGYLGHGQLGESRGEVVGIQLHAGLGPRQVFPLLLGVLRQLSVEAPYRKFQGLPPPSQEGE